LISQCTSHFKIGNDTASLLRISDSLSTLSTFRSQHLSSLSTQLSALSRTHQTLSANHSHTVSQHNAVDHASEILRLDTEKFKIAKQASDLEIEGERLQQEMGRLASVAGDLDEEGVEGGVVERPGEDATV
jgi:kinetochore protein Spc24